MLVDGGSVDSSSLIYSYLKSNGIKHLDYMVATHPDADHIGGLSGALNYTTVDTAYCPFTSYDTDTFADSVAEQISSPTQAVVLMELGTVASNNTEETYVLNTNTHKFHRPGCSSVNDMKEKNKKIVTESRMKIIEEGYVPCKRCKP